MRPQTWWRLLRDGRFAISPSKLSLVAAVSFATPFNTGLGWLQRAIYGRKLSAASFHGPPIFIIGHWRSGTTLLHELMVKDERLSSPSTFQCFAPHHFLVTEWAFRRFFTWLLPQHRPMDNMQTGWDRPQEDEFAMLNLGYPSPYRRIAFPDQPPPDVQFLDTESVDWQAADQWAQGLQRFLLAVSCQTQRPLIVKSPTHTGRVATLARTFPGAKFIHISRDPRALFPSTVRLWKSLDQVQGLQVPSGSDGEIEDYVIHCLKVMYDAFHRQREQIAADHLIDIRYEDLVSDPVGQVERIYRQLHLGGFDPVRETLQQWAETEHRDYQTNRHRLPADQEQRIRAEWADYFQRYGY